MSLMKYAKENNKEIHDRPVSFRMNSAVYNEFEEYCHSLNLDVSEALRLLIHEELKKKGETNQQVPPSPSSRPRRTGKRFSVEPYLNPDGKNITCPICNTPISKKNISRHAKDVHGTTTKGLFQSE